MGFFAFQTSLQLNGKGWQMGKWANDKWTANCAQLRERKAKIFPLPQMGKSEEEGGKMEGRKVP
jgi:hypothetical protein